MPSAKDLLVERYASLDALFAALDSHKPARAAIAGCVRIHPARFWGKRLSDHSAVRKRLEAYGLRLLITAAIEPNSVELRRYTPAAGAGAG
jgi:hypothetical protein